MSTKSLRALRTLSLSILLSMLLIPVLPAWAEGGGDALEEHSDDVVILTVGASEPKRESVDDELGSSEDLLDSYLDQRLKERLPKKRRLLAAKGVGDRLTGNDAVAYGIVKEAVRQIAAGERSSTSIEIPLELICGKTTFTADELGVSAIMIDGSLNPEVYEALDSYAVVDYPRIVQALLSDCPYELYWFDKAAGYYFSPSARYLSISYDSSSVTLEGNPSIQLAVAEEYSAGEFLVSTPVGENVENAVANAAAIVDANTGKSSFEKLQAYKQAICDRVRYDDVASSNPDSSNGGPWQLISVFDDDPDTNVVCEGYSKAFKYLCDLSGFSDIECKLVSGTMTGGTGAGGHMWNVLAMPDGKNYLVDVTNCDEDSAGYPDELFFKGFADEGTVTFDDGSAGLFYAYETSGGQIGYMYDSQTLDTYDRSELVMSATDYDPSSVIELASISSATVQASDVTYDGTPQEPTPTVTLDGVTLALGTDYTVASYADNIDAGTATVTVEGTGSYEGTATGTFTIMPKQVAPVVTLSAASFIYNGTQQLPTIASVTVDGEAIDSSSYTATEPENCTDAGTYSITVTLNEGGNYVGSGTASFVIAKANQTIDVTAKTLSVGKSDELGAIASGGGALSYSSSDELVVTVDESGVLTGVGVGTATITITAAATNNYEAATADVEVSVVAQSGPLSLKEANVSFAENTYIYDGSAKEPEVIVNVNGTTLVRGVDYDVSYDDNTDAGTATAIITGRGAYTGEVSKTFTIEPKWAEPVITLSATSFTYDGAAHLPTITAVSVDGAKLSESAYTVTEPEGCTDAGAYTLVVTLGEGGNYVGSGTADFTIKRATIAVPKAKSGLVYTGKSQAGVAAGTGYTLSGTTKATKAGSYTAYATPDANHAWSDGTTAQKKLAWSIAAKKVTPKVTLAKTSYVYDGKVKKPAVTVMVGSTKLTTSDYTVTYASGRKLVGTYKVTVKLRGNYSGSKSVTFNIIPKGTAISKVTTASKGFTVVWKKQATQTNGYQIQYSTSKTFASGNKTVTVSKTGTTSKKVGSLKAKKVYYVRVRTYRKVGSRTYYSAWSAPKSIRTN